MSSKETTPSLQDTPPREGNLTTPAPPEEGGNLTTPAPPEEGGEFDHPCPSRGSSGGVAGEA